MHIPVLLHEVLQFLSIKKGETVLDATAGGGGHTRALSDAVGAKGKVIAIDADSSALARVRDGLRGAACRAEFIHGNFRDLGEMLQGRGISAIDKALFDLGLSSDQLEYSGRGFSFERDEPLLMTFADRTPEGTLTAYEIVNSWGEGELVDILHVYGEERRARGIVRAIVAARKIRPIGTTRELVRVIEGVAPPREMGRIHPATKTFQALRIAVNDEIGALEEGLDAAFKALRAGGRMAVISFHSIEDRTVKHYFADLARSGRVNLLTKKPITPTETEVSTNRRSRSAKMRAIEKA
ncbi:MAG: 16S rRNA (cytosine(1402)-N(4))-methyltransferase RsmH [bacterium]|nr:16S rRNA (cytosine(1402)-N(4))-methyltransferase RsmH [bacterium]MDZ4285195.1 16S rRNA (cytosine(1402)-N(4))-methyltransferase RsmH [Patescibacteria group bacterium]